MIAFLPQEVIRAKRDGHALEAAQIAAFLEAASAGSVNDAQLSAFAMAVFFQGMSQDECVALTRGLRDSGETLDWSSCHLNGPVIDKHSTGGVGDTVSLMLAPMLAACGAHVPMISGRGLGHTGGTLDKLDSIPGYRSTPDLESFRRVVSDVGCAIIGQTRQLAPLDGRLYSLRDVTATIESIPLITASILSKKLAAGLEALVMDIKFGSGAFMARRDDAAALGRSLIDVGNAAGLRTVARLTDMNQPLAPVAGNAIEVRCAIDYLTGRDRPARLHEVTLELGAALLEACGLSVDVDEARTKLMQTLDSGAAADRFARMVDALGGPADLTERPEAHLAVAPIVVEVRSATVGRITQVDVRALGLAVVRLGGGRIDPGAPIDHAVGLVDFAELGQRVAFDDVIARVHARSASDADAARQAVIDAFTVAPD